MFGDPDEHLLILNLGNPVMLEFNLQGKYLAHFFLINCEYGTL